jgi:hypothetical protein
MSGTTFAIAEAAPPFRSTSVRELALAAAWHGGMLSDLHTTDGRSWRIVHRGNWSHGFGPDFTNAILEVDGRELVCGDVEIHLAASDWHHHRHHLDPAYNGVVLHVVTRPDLLETRLENGHIAPLGVVSLPDDVLFAIDRALPGIWPELGASVCAGHVAAAEPQRIRAALHWLGDQRFHQRVTRFGGELEVDSLTNVMVRGIFDAMGYARNREPIGYSFDSAQQTGTLDWWQADPGRWREEDALGLILGTAGFLPLSPLEANLAGIQPEQVPSIEASWRDRCSHLANCSLPATTWDRARSRPANHPAARLASLARLLQATGGDPTPVFLGAIRQHNDCRQLVRGLSSSTVAGMGLPRATAMVATVVLPLLMAWAQREGDSQLEDDITRLWVGLPRSEWSRPAIRARGQVAGDVPLGALGERAIQGLLHLDRDLCSPRRCFECPIAAEVVAAARRDRLRDNDIPQSMSSVDPT